MSEAEKLFIHVYKSKNIERTKDGMIDRLGLHCHVVLCVISLRHLSHADIAGPNYVAGKPKTMFLNGLSRRTWTLLNEAKIVFNSEPNLNFCKHGFAAINSVRTFSTNQPHLAATATKEKVLGCPEGSP